jgi:uncharacterized phage protein gp47/JayE
MADRTYFLNWQEVLEQLLSFLPPSWRSNLSGKILKRLLVAFSLAVEALYALLARLLRLSIVATSEGFYLRSLVSAFNMTTYAGTKAIVPVRFRRYGEADTAIVIPAGRLVESVTGLQFATTTQTTMIVGEREVLVPCICTQPGIIGNIPSGEIIGLVTPIAGISFVTNDQPGGGGNDAESDLEIKERLPKHIEALHRATIPATEYSIAIDREKFPEVQRFVTQRNYGNPGYFRGILCDWTGGDRYRPTNWVSVGNGVWYTTTDLPEIKGLVAAGWMCNRFGVVERSADGEEIWKANNFVAEVEQGNWRYCHDVPRKRLYARAEGQDLNELHITIYAEVIWRALRELEQRWAANGVFLDIIVPFTTTAIVEMNYKLEDGYQQLQVESELRNAVYVYVNKLYMGDVLQIEELYAALNKVRGAFGVTVTSPTSNVTPPAANVVRLERSPVILKR